MQYLRKEVEGDIFMGICLGGSSGPHHGDQNDPHHGLSVGPHHGQSIGLSLNPKSFCVGWLRVVGKTAEAYVRFKKTPPLRLI